MQTLTTGTVLFLPEALPPFGALRILVRWECETDALKTMITGWPGWRRLPAATDRNGVVFQAPAHPSAALAMAAGLRLHASCGLEMTTEATAAVRRLTISVEAAHDFLKDRTISLFPWPTERAARHHQFQALNAAGALDFRVMLNDDMGLGKTATALWLWHQSHIPHLLVLCPVNVKWNWAKEVTATLDTTFRELGVHVIRKMTPKKRAEELELIAALRVGSLRTVTIINYDQLRVLGELGMRHLTHRVEALICDESHYVKDRAAERSQLTAEIAKQCKFVVTLTGTPVRNTIEDLFHQIELVRPGTWTSFNDFEKRHLVIRMIDVGPKVEEGHGKQKRMRKVVDQKNSQALAAIVNTVQIRRLKSEVLNLPPKIHTFPELELDDVTQRIYNEMKRYTLVALSELGVDDSIFAPRARSGLEAAMRCEQIAQGFIGGIPEPLQEKMALTSKIAKAIPGRPNEFMFPQSAKVEWLLEMIDDLSIAKRPALIAFRFNAPLFWFKAELERRGVLVDVLHGQLTDKEGPVNKFQQGAVDFLLAQVSMCQGFNLTRAQDVIFYGRDWSPAVNAQCEDRAHRMGQAGTVSITIPIVRGTIEVPIHAKLAAKDADAQSALKGMTVKELMEAL